MDNEKLKQFLVPILVLVITILAIIFLAPKVIQNFQDYRTVKAEVDNNTIKLNDKKKQLEDAKRKAELEAQKEKNVSQEAKAFYKPIETGLDNEAVIAGEFAEILKLIRANQIKVRSIKYDYNPEDDNFLRELYKHEHFLDIQSVEIVPYRKDKRILLINFKMKLYSKV